MRGRHCEVVGDVAVVVIVAGEDQTRIGDVEQILGSGLQGSFVVSRVGMCRVLSNECGTKLGKKAFETTWTLPSRLRFDSSLHYVRNAKGKKGESEE